MQSLNVHFAAVQQAKAVWCSESFAFRNLIAFMLCLTFAGQEKREVPGARHTACTVEMAGLTEEYDVAVIDEIQACTHL